MGQICPEEGAFGTFGPYPPARHARTLVHVFSAPVGYLTRPYLVYRSRDVTRLGSHRPRAGWERVTDLPNTPRAD